MPWRRRKTRPEAPELKAARAERKHSEVLRREALALAREIDHIRQQNHFAEALRRIIEGEQ